MISITLNCCDREHLMRVLDAYDGKSHEIRARPVTEDEIESAYRAYHRRIGPNAHAGMRGALESLLQARVTTIETAPDDGGFLPSDGAIYRNRKTGGYYRVLANGRIEATRDLVTIYQPLDGMMTWVRPTKEFGERFAYVPNGEIPDVELRAAGLKP